MLQNNESDIPQLYHELSVCMKSYLQMILQGCRSDMEMNSCWKTVEVLRHTIERKTKLGIIPVSKV